MARGNQKAERKTGVAAWNESVGIASREENSRHNKAQADRKRRMALLVVLGIVLVACVVCCLPIQDSITRGLWLKEGVAHTMRVAGNDGAQPSSSDVDTSISIVSRRLGSLNASDPAVMREGSDAMLVEFPTFVEDSEKLAKLVGGKGKLELIRMDEIGDADALAKINAGTSGVELAPNTYTAFMDGSYITSASVSTIMPGYYAITLNFNEEGKTKFADVTRELAESSGSVAIAVDGRVLSTPSVSEEINTGQVSISGVFSENEVNAIKSIVDTGELPCDTSYEGSKAVNAIVGQAGKWGMVCAAAVILIVVSALAFKTFKKLAIVIAGALATYGILMLGLMAAASRLNMYVLTMPGVLAGFIGALATAFAAWRVCACFREHVASGGSYRGAAMTCVSEGVKPLVAPLSVVSVICIVFVFLPATMLRDFGITGVYSVVCGILAICWYAVTTLRLNAAGAIKEQPEKWGINVTVGDDA